MAVGFANPIFLWAIGLAVIPLWIHLSRRRKFKKLDTGTLRFLEDARRSRRRKARWEEILLMLLRIGATILLALLFARPTFPGSAVEDSGSGRVLLLLDASGSMDAEMTKAARKLAQAALRKASGKSGESVVMAQYSDRVEVLESLEEYKPTAGAPTRLGTVINWSLDHLLKSKTPEAGKLIMIGHFSNSSLPESPPRVWPAGIEVELIPIRPAKEVNSAVTGIELRTPFETEEMELEARLQLPPEENVSVKLEVEGFVEEKELPPGTGRVLFQFRPNRDVVRGWVSVDTDTDSWPADNRRPFVFQWTERSRVLLIDGKPGGTPFEGQAYFLKKALQASGAEHGLSPISPEIAYGLKSKTGLLDLSGFSVVALCGVGEVTSSEAELLHSYVEAGGGLLIVLGEGWDPAGYTSLISAGLFPDKVSRNSSQTRRIIEKWDDSHPAMSAFGTIDGGDLSSLFLRDGFDVYPESCWASVGELEGGKAVLLEKGRVMVCPHPLNREWTDLPREPIFVPFVKSLFSYLGNIGEPPAPSEERIPGIEETREPGWYELPDRPTQVVVTDSKESEVSSAELSEVIAALGLPKIIAGSDSDAEEKDAIAEIEERFQPRAVELWPWIALLLLCCFVVEGVVATARPA